MTEIARKLAEYSNGLDYSDISDSAIHETKRRFIDTLACGINTFRVDSVRSVRKISSWQPKTGPTSTLIGTNIRCPPDYAAFSNGYAMRYLDWNDTYLSKEPAHPSDNIAGILSIAEAFGKNGKDIILSTLIGYEIQCRLCDAASLRSRGWDHVNYLLIGNALAASKLMGLSTEKSTQSVNIALNNLSTRQNRVGELSNWKAAAASNTVRNAVFSAMLAGVGFTGPSEMVEGKWGFQNQVSGKFSIDTSIFGKNGSEFMLEKSYIKKNDGEIHSQSAIDIALELRKEIRSINDIESMRIDTQEAGFTIIGDRDKEPQKWNPMTKETADHSIAYIATVALMDGEVTEKQFARDRFRDKRTLEFLKKVKVVEDSEFTDAYPYRGIANRITIKLKNGKTISKEEYFQRGHPKNPMSDEEIENKFIHLASHNLGEKRTRKVLDFLWKIDEVKNLRDLFKMLVVR
jgi:2-methylcitrate dehydratase